MWLTILVVKYESPFTYSQNLNYNYLTEFQKQLAFRPDLNTRPQPPSLACKFPIGGTFGEFTVFHAFSRAKSTFWEYLLQVNIISCGKLKNVCGKLRNNNRCKIMSRKLLRLNISNVDRTTCTLVPKGECPKFFTCSRYTSPSTKHGYWPELQITLYFWETLLQPKACLHKFCKGSLWGIFKKL